MNSIDDANFLLELRQTLSDDISEYCTGHESKSTATANVFMPRQPQQQQSTRKPSAFSLKSPSMRAVLSADALNKAATTQSPTSSDSSSGSESITKLTNEYTYLSNTEKAILNSTKPMQLNMNDEIEINGIRGIWVNKDEVLEWKKGDLPIDQYPLNVDIDPRIINKKLDIPLQYVQELAIRYLKPPTPYVYFGFFKDCF